MGATPTYGFRYPQSTDTSDGPKGFQDLATDVEDRIKLLPEIHYGLSDPSNSLGKDGDVYVKYQQ